MTMLGIVAKNIVRRHYTEEDVEKAWYLQNKFQNVNTIAKDSCFHFHYMGEVEERDYDNNPRNELKNKLKNILILN